MEKHTRTHTLQTINFPETQVTPLVRAVDAAFAPHALPTFHHNPRPHFSVAWCPGDQRVAAERAVESLEPRVWLEAHVKALDCRVGQHVHCVWSGDRP